MGTWSKELVSEFNSIIEKCKWADTFSGTIQKDGRLNLVKDFFTEKCLDSFPSPIMDKESIDFDKGETQTVLKKTQYLRFEKGFNPYWLWDQCVKINDARLLEFLISKGMPLPGDAIFNGYKQYVISFDFGLHGNFDFLYNSKSDFYIVSDTEATETRNFLLAAFRSGFLDTSCENFYLGVRILIVAAEDLELMREALKKYNFGILLEHATRNTDWWSRFFSVNKISYLPLLSRWFSKQNAVYGVRKRKWNEIPVHILPGTSVEMLEAGLKFAVNFIDVCVSCDRDVLLWAASHGVTPEIDVMEFGRFDSGFSDSHEAAMQKISQDLDYDVIKAFLVANLLKEADAECARRADRRDILSLYSEFSVPKTCSTIYYGSSYVCEFGKVVIPDGVRKIEKFAFRASDLGENIVETVDSLYLPSSLEVINEGAFYGLSFDRVTVPSRVSMVRQGAFFGSEFITIYDSLGAVPKGQKRRSPRPDRNDPLAPYCNQISVPIGFIGASLSRRNGHKRLLYDELSIKNFTIEVRSAKTDKVLYRVWMPLAEVGKEQRNFFLSNWGSNASFGFGYLDKEFDGLPQKVKFRVALDRLRWHVRLKAVVKDKYCSYVTKYRQLIAKDCCMRDSVDDLEFLVECSQKPLNIGKLIAEIQDLSCSEEIRTYLNTLK